MIMMIEDIKFNLFGSDGRQYLKRQIETEHDFKYQKGADKHDGGNIIVRRFFSYWYWFHNINWRKIDRFVYKTHILSFEKNNMPLIRKFQHFQLNLWQNLELKIGQSCFRSIRKNIQINLWNIKWFKNLFYIVLKLII